MAGGVHVPYFAKLMTKAAAVLDGTWSWRSDGLGRRRLCRMYD